MGQSMISAILLAAGQSRRMGSFKQLLPFGSTTIIDSCINSLRATNITELIIVVGYRGEEVNEHVQAHHQDTRIKLITNSQYLTGMTSSVQAGLRAISPQSQALLLALVDQPRVTSQTITQLTETYYQTDTTIIKPRYLGQSGHPIIMARSCWREILALSADQGLNLVTRAYQSQTHYLEVTDSGVIADIDTPDDYEREIRKGCEESGSY